MIIDLSYSYGFFSFSRGILRSGFHPAGRLGHPIKPDPRCQVRYPCPVPGYFFLNSTPFSLAMNSTIRGTYRPAYPELSARMNVWCTDSAMNDVVGSCSVMLV